MRVLVVGEAVSLAHVVRPMVLAQGLAERGYDVRFACGRRYQSLPESAGLAVHDLPTISAGEFYGNIAKGRPVYSEEQLRDYVRSELHLFAELPPDLVVGDMRLSLSTSCELNNVPYICLANAHWSPYSALPFPLPDVPAVRLFGKQLSRRLMPLVLPAVFRRLAGPANRMRRAWGLKPFANLRELYTRGDFTAYLDMPEISPTANLPANHRYLGPALWEPDVEMPAWAGRLRPGARRAYVTLGSTGDRGVLGSTVKALLSLDFEVMVTAGPGELPWSEAQRVFAAPALPGLKAAGLSDVVVCHGGSGTVYQALSRGVPVVGICSNPDQQLVMAGVERAGAGAVLLARSATEKAVLDAVRSATGAKPRLAALNLSRELPRWDACAGLAGLIAEALGTAGQALKPSDVGTQLPAHRTMKSR